MKIILHRINNIKNIPHNFGVEVDIHGWGNDLTIHHDAFVNGTNFDEWLTHYHNHFIIFNIKEEGIEERVLEKINKFNVKEYFFLDLSFPALVKMAQKGIHNCAFRVSKYEAIEGAYSFKSKVKWIWLDVFEGIPITKDENLKLKLIGYDICLVSPELHGRDEKEIYEMKDYIHKNEFQIDAVCTKKPELW